VESVSERPPKESEIAFPPLTYLWPKAKSRSWTSFLKYRKTTRTHALGHYIVRTSCEIEYSDTGGHGRRSALARHVQWVVLLPLLYLR
jgi:hypothetical protein